MLVRGEFGPHAAVDAEAGAGEVGSWKGGVGGGGGGVKGAEDEGGRGEFADV